MPIGISLLRLLSRTADVAANLKAIADEFSLPRLAAGVSAATQTASEGSGVCWVRTADGKWMQTANDDSQLVSRRIASTYTEDLSRLVLVDDVTAETPVDFVALRVKQVDGLHKRAISVARPLLLTSAFFRALLDGGFAETQHLLSSSDHLEVSADSADALVLCLQMLASGDTDALMPSSADDVLEVLVEAHRLGFPQALSAAEKALGQIVVSSDLDVVTLEAIANAAQLYDMQRLAREASAKYEIES